MSESFSETNVAGLELADGTPKPTSLTGQTESFTDLWVSPDSRLEMGVWECTPGTFTATRNGYDENAHIVSGTATLTDYHGVVKEL